MEENGLPQEVLDNTDVLIWWGNAAHDAVKNEVAERVVHRVNDGMGLICLHSSHMSKVFRWLLGTEGSLKWRYKGEKCRVWTVMPNHPIAQGVPENFVLDSEEMYGEPFGIPTPDELVFITWYEGCLLYTSRCHTTNIYRSAL